MISLVVPSRRRPDRYKEMVESALDTANGHLQFITRLDEDDESYKSYPHYGPQIIARRGVLSDAWNDGARLADGDYIMMAADDLIFRTGGWDTLVEKAFQTLPDGIGLVHVNDGFQNERIATHPIITRQWYQTVTYLCPPYFTADYNDVWLHEVADAIGRRLYLPDVLVEHMHPDAGKSDFDIVYQEQRARRDNDNVAGVYESLADIRGRWVRRLQGAMWEQERSTSSNG